jgi:membrane-associated protease RseP (regulator of RpoE activity)
MTASFVSGAAVHAGQPNFDDPDFQSRVQQANEAVKELSADDYHSRRMAFAKLLSIGRPAIEPLEKAQQSEDAEVRSRAMELLILMRGRGFLGVRLLETDDWNADGIPDQDNAQVTVRAMTVINHRSPEFASLGINKPLPAEAAGMMDGDRLVAVNDRPINGTKDLMREIISLGPARTAMVTIERAGKIQRLPVVLTRNPQLQRGAYGVEPDDIPPVDLEKELDPPKPEPSAFQSRELEREHQAAAPQQRIVPVLQDDVPAVNTGK